MKTTNMEVLFDLDAQIEKLVKQKQKDFVCAITLYRDKETDSAWMSVLTFDCKVWDDIKISDNLNKDRISTGIMRWFKAHGNEVKGG